MQRLDPTYVGVAAEETAAKITIPPRTQAETLLIFIFSRPFWLGGNAGSNSFADPVPASAVPALRYPFGMEKKIWLAAAVPFLVSAVPAAIPASREATSRAEWTGRTRRTVNRRFTFSAIHPEAKGSKTLLLDETFDRGFDSQAEGETSTTEVEAFALQGDAKTPLWKIRTRGSDGAPDGELYRITRMGCCGSQNLDLYFSLLDGRELFSSDGPILRLEVPNTAVRRYVGYHSLMAASPVPEAAGRKDVVGVLTYGGDRAPAARFLVIVKGRPAKDDDARKGLFFIRGDESVEGPVFELWSADGKSDRAAIGGFAIRVTDFAKDDFLVEIPVAGDRLDVARAKTAPGISLKELP